ncbi:hypothetical protein [Aquimarina algiphila]|uniref:hypothetical protein n=1 Tax=Aquimarina algiphila TaxID=2047982 RepID=UPI002330AE20|nr:hypothetical protein [Aquimarina algiphila]
MAYEYENTIMIISFSMTGIISVFGFMKKLRNNKLLLILLLITLLIGLFGYISSNYYIAVLSGRLSYSLFGPFIYVLSYGLLRIAYKKTFNKEPSYERYSWYDYEDGRKLNVFDLLVHIIPMLLGFILPILLFK